MDLLLDVNIVLDICQPRPEHLPAALKAISQCRREGGRMWLYAGSVQTLEYNLVRGLVETAQKTGSVLPRPEAHRRARRLLMTFARDKHWLAALAGEGDVFTAEDPEDEQLLRALERFHPGTIRLLTRDIPAYALMTGVPARRIGWMSRHGERLELPLKGKGRVICPHGGVVYTLSGETITITG